MEQKKIVPKQRKKDTEIKKTEDCFNITNKESSPIKSEDKHEIKEISEKVSKGKSQEKNKEKEGKMGEGKSSHSKKKKNRPPKSQEKEDFKAEKIEQKTSPYIEKKYSETLQEVTQTVFQLENPSEYIENPEEKQQRERIQQLEMDLQEAIEKKGKAELEKSTMTSQLAAKEKELEELRNRSAALDTQIMQIEAQIGIENSQIVTEPETSSSLKLNTAKDPTVKKLKKLRKQKAEKERIVKELSSRVKLLEMENEKLDKEIKNSQHKKIIQQSNTSSTIPKKATQADYVKELPQMKKRKSKLQHEVAATQQSVFRYTFICFSLGVLVIIFLIYKLYYLAHNNSYSF